MLSTEIRAFAVTRLRLPDNGSYTQFVQTGRDAVTWNVVAAPEFSLAPRRWCFLVSGCVPYRGYFRQQDAEKFAGKLARDGYDTVVSPAIAYSTLGWFDDPLLDTMFQYSDEQLAAFIFHEMAHQALYVRGDTAFNESYASFVEETGVRLWLASNGQQDRLEDWRTLQRAGREYDELLRETQSQLRTLYASGKTEESMRKEKRGIFETLAQRYQALVETRWAGHEYLGPVTPENMNNARLVLANRYRGGICAFRRIYLEAGEDMARFQQLAAARAALGRERRREWLQQPCEVIASGDDL
jgi:predicted aminopeptidase